VVLHVRVVSPAALTGQLAGLLAVALGVQNVVVRAGAARRPDGDAVEFDVRDGAANPVFRPCASSPGPGRRDLRGAVIRQGEAYAPSFYVLLALCGGSWPPSACSSP
jgi:hypothetical protein